jgi:hypothetical protein
LSLYDYFSICICFFQNSPFLSCDAINYLLVAAYTGEVSKFEVLNAQSYAGYVVHVGTLGASGSVAVGNAATVHVDYDRRALVAPNHTMTHVLNFALRSVLVFNNPTGSAGTSRHTLHPAFSFIAIYFPFFVIFSPSALCFFSLVFAFPLN